MKNQEIKFRNKNNAYSIIIGRKVISQLSKHIKLSCPKTRNIALIIDKNVPRSYKNALINQLKNFKVISYSFQANEKAKSLKYVGYFLNQLLSKNFNRNDLIVAVGGGITGDVVGFVASIFKRGINFINIPTTLLAQVDSAIGGKTGVNSIHGKNLIGAFYQPKLVLIDTSFLNSLPKKEMVCGYAEILKHAIIKDRNFFNWLKKNSQNIFLKKNEHLIHAIKKSCKIKINFVQKDVNEKGLRMSLNFGHTFAHAIEVKNNYSKNLTHGEAVLAGIILATRLSIVKKVCKLETLNEILKIYQNNQLNYTFQKYNDYNFLLNLIPYLKNDKKNNDDKINFILLKKIGQTTKPNTYKISIKNLKKYCRVISQC